MREIKFRAWDKILRVMEKVLVFYHNNQSVYFIHKGSSQNREIEHVEIMQFTGLLDSNGVEIYSGDILLDLSLDDKDSDRIPRQVTWYESIVSNGWHAPFIKPHWALSYSDISLSQINKRYTVIGNIHSNPEMMEGE